MEKYYNNSNYKYSDITGKIIKASIEVHKKLGCGFKEAIYQKALAKEMNKLEVGLLINFGSLKQIEIKRMVL